MNKVYSTFILSILYIACIHAQSTAYLKMPSLGVHFFYNDFKKTGFKDMDAGFAISYMQGISNHFDFSSAFSTSFLDYPKGDTVLGKNKALLEWDFLIHAKMFSDKHIVSLYLSAGIGASKYAGYYGVFFPAGAGVQVHIFNKAFLLINTQYRVKLADNTSNHFYYNIGVTGNIVRKKKRSVVKNPPVIAVQTLPPASDRDNDGVADKDDKCPGVPGMARYGGCPVPDRDKDGINDEEDKCPDVPGVVANKGCPAVNGEDKELAKKVAYAARNIFFATGSADLLETSEAALNIVVGILSDSLNLKLEINGHTDNEGTPEMNQILSQRRADRVKDYLIKKGIAADRLTAKGFGQSRPVADNTKPEGRAKNRRVEFSINYR